MPLNDAAVQSVAEAYATACLVDYEPPVDKDGVLLSPELSVENMHTKLVNSMKPLIKAIFDGIKNHASIDVDPGTMAAGGDPVVGLGVGEID